MARRLLVSVRFDGIHAQMPSIGCPNVSLSPHSSSKSPMVLVRRSQFASKVFSPFYFCRQVLSSNAEHGV